MKKYNESEVIHFDLWGNASKRGPIHKGIILTRGTLSVVPGDKVLVVSKTGAEKRGTVEKVHFGKIELTIDRTIEIIDLFTVKDIVILTEAH